MFYKSQVTYFILVGPLYVVGHLIGQILIAVVDWKREFHGQCGVGWILFSCDKNATTRNPVLTTLLGVIERAYRQTRSLHKSMAKSE